MRLSTPRKTLLLPLFALLVALSTACIKADMGVSVNDDGSGTITLVEAVDTKAFADAMKQFGGALGGGSSPTSPTDIFSEKDVDKSKLPPGTKVEAYKEGNYQGVKITTPFSKPDEVLSTLNKVSDAVSDSTVGGLGSLGGGSNSRPSGGTSPGRSPTPSRSSGSSNTAADAFEKFVIEKTSDGWKFEASAKSVGGGSLGDDAMSQALLGSILKDASVTLTMRLPGKVTQTNADSNSNGTLVWKLPLTSTSSKTFTATTVGSGTSSGGGDDDGFPIIVVIGVVVAVVVIGGLYYMSKQKQASPPPPPPPVPGTTA